MNAPDISFTCHGGRKERGSGCREHRERTRRRGICYAQSRGNLRATIFHKAADYLAFEPILQEALEIYRVQLISYQRMPNHFHLVLRPLVDGELGRLMGWVVGTLAMR